MATRKRVTDPEEAAREGYAKSRVAQVPGEWIIKAGGLGLLAKRGTAAGVFNDLQTMEGLQRLARQNPMLLLQLIPSIVPEVDLAKWNFLRLGASAEAVRIKGMSKGADGKGVEAPDGTDLINDLWESQPDEIGDFPSILGKNTMMVLFTGQSMVEAVPQDNGAGVKEVWPINPITVSFKRENDMSLGLYQKQYTPVNTNAPALLSNFVQLPKERTFWKSMDAMPDDPYPSAPFAPVLTEVLTYLGMIYSLSLAWKRVGLPKYDIGFDFEMWYRIGQTLTFLQTPEDIEAWVREKFMQAQKDFSAMDPDSAFFHDKESKVGVTGQASAWPNVESIFNIYRSRLVMALKQLPALMGIVDGSTETWTITQWKIWSAGLETIIKAAAMPLVRSAGLHLRLLGKPYKAALEYNPVRVSQRLVDAQAEAQEIENEISKRDQGWQTQDESAMVITGTAAVEQEPPVQRMAREAQEAQMEVLATRNQGGGQGNGKGKGKDSNPETRSEEGRGQQAAADIRRLQYRERNRERRIAFEREERIAA